YLAKSGNELALEQSYSFTDKGGRHVIMRPELTPSLARMISARGSELPKPLRWMSMPLCFRYEKPQRGRVREFLQFNCDILGCDSPGAELEMMLLLRRIMSGFGARAGQYEIRYSSRRLAAVALERAGFGPGDEMLAAFALMDKRAKMTPESWRQLLRDSLQDPAREESLSAFASCRSPDDEWLASIAGDSGPLEEVRALARMLAESGVEEVVFDASIVRGLDYYTGVVFEVLDTGSENRRAICGGGRYDDLTGIFPGERISGVGFGLGVLSLKLFLETYGLLDVERTGESGPADVYMAVTSDEDRPWATRAAELIRDAGVRTAMDITGRSLTRQLGQADRMGVRLVVIAGPDERSRDVLTLRDMTTGDQVEVPLADIGRVTASRLGRD
ncbi:ATP phosphoribosyltransferase regulatory subunit, partial [Candidatus Fermentibacterales bacterium]|nr:ATP phosphoribosyltransferase regulatory subunit [Candidatus Fermentibacterales bacterium]